MVSVETRDQWHATACITEKELAKLCFEENFSWHFYISWREERERENGRGGCIHHVISVIIPFPRDNCSSVYDV